MQRRAAAVSVVAFLLVGTVAYGLIATAEKPHVEIDGGERLAENDTFAVGGQTYTVSAVETETSGGGGGGHGGGGGEATEQHVATIEWTVEDAQHTENWANGSVVTYDGKEWEVQVEDAEDPTSFTLVEQIDRQAILQNDSDADNETVTRDGEEYVVVEQEGEDNAELVPAEEYFPEPERREFTEGESIDYQGNDATVETVESGGATLAWTAPKNNSVEVGNHENVTLSGETYFAHFPDGKTLVLSQDFEQLRQEQQEIDDFTRHRNGLWGISLTSWVFSILLIGMAYLPSRY